MDGLNIFSVISVNQHPASVLPFPYYGQTLPELLRHCLRAVRRKPVPPAIRPTTNALSNSNSRYTYPSSGSYAAWLTLKSNTASDSWPSPPLDERLTDTNKKKEAL